MIGYIGRYFIARTLYGWLAKSGRSSVRRINNRTKRRTKMNCRNCGENSEMGPFLTFLSTCVCMIIIGFVMLTGCVACVEKFSTPNKTSQVSRAFEETEVQCKEGGIVL